MMVCPRMVHWLERFRGPSSFPAPAWFSMPFSSSCFSSVLATRLQTASLSVLNPLAVNFPLSFSVADIDSGGLVVPDREDSLRLPLPSDLSSSFADSQLGPLAAESTAACGGGGSDAVAVGQVDEEEKEEAAAVAGDEVAVEAPSVVGLDSRTPASCKRALQACSASGETVAAAAAAAREAVSKLAK